MGENRTLIDCNVYPSPLEIHSQFHHRLVSWSALLTKGSCNERPYMVDPDNIRPEIEKVPALILWVFFKFALEKLEHQLQILPLYWEMNALK